MPGLLTIAKHINWRDVEGELVLYHEHTGVYHVLNPVASFIWRNLAHGAAADVIASQLAERYAAPPGTIAEELDAFIAEALDLELIEIQAPDAKA